MRAGGVLEAATAAAGIALAIIGLAGGAPGFLMTIATIVLGAAFLFERWTAAGEAQAGLLPAEHEHRGLTAEAVAGWSGIALGILSLLRLAPHVLAPVAVIAFGGGLVLGTRFGTRTSRTLLGIAAIALGILALLQADPRMLALVGLLAVGAALLLTAGRIRLGTRSGAAR